MRPLLSVVAIAALLPVGAAAQDQCEMPGILVVLDRSISMRGEIDGVTKWDIATDAISSVLGTHGDSAAFGLMLYPGPSGSGANGVNGAVGACNFNHVDAGCAPETPRCTTGEVVVDIAENTRPQIEAALQWPGQLSHSYTPTWQSLEAANDYGRLHVANRRDFVILVTDGWQCCGLYINGDGSQGCEPEDRNLVVDKVAELRNSDVTTFVVGFGDNVDVQTLQRAAVAAGTQREGCDPDALGGNNLCYYQASRHDDLGLFLDDIVRRIADEICDGRDNNCDGRVDEDLERACESACGAGVQQCFNGDWGRCDAAAPEPEQCNGEDDNCDGRVDEDLRRPCNNACGRGQETCNNGRWGNCDAPAVEAEVCDGIDNDCDGVVDPGCACQPGEERRCGENVGACRQGVQRCDRNGQWGDCDGGQGPSREECDGVDNDCDGQVDGFDRICQNACGGGDETCIDGQWQGCDAPEVFDEVCDGVDDDCDGQIDENLSRGCETACGVGREVCELGRWTGCDAPQPIDEVCGNGTDDDCDGSTDEQCECQDGDTQECNADVLCEPGTQRCVGGLWGDCEGGTPAGTEVCNGLDDDCDGVADEGNDLCEADQICACGACMDPCVNFECPNESQCINGHCIEDRCPDGLVCDNLTCVPGDGEGRQGDDPPLANLVDGGVDPAGTSSDAGCSCDTGETGTGAWWMVSLLLLGLRRRR